MTCDRLYPELPAVVESAKDKVGSVQPFTDEQLRSLYYNYELEHVDEFVDEFLRVIVSSAVILFILV